MHGEHGRRAKGGKGIADQKEPPPQQLAPFFVTQLLGQLGLLAQGVKEEIQLATGR